MTGAVRPWGAGALLACAAAVAACAGAPPAPPPAPPAPKAALPPALCVLDHPDTREPDAAAWIALLLRGFDPVTRRVTTPAIDCTGAQVRWEQPALTCDDGVLARTVLPPRPLSQADVHTADVAPRTKLVWIATTEFASGDALGPVALVTVTPEQLRAVTLGVLRAYPARVRLQIEDLGRRPVLLAGGDRCAAPGDASCVRASRLVPIRGDRFVPTPLAGAEGQCLSPAWFETSRTVQRRGPLGWERVDLSATLEFGADELRVDELMLVQDVGAAQGGPVQRTLQRAQASRTVRWVGDRLVASGPPLWATVAPAARAP